MHGCLLVFGQQLTLFLYQWDILTICDAVMGVGLGAIDRIVMPMLIHLCQSHFSVALKNYIQ